MRESRVDSVHIAMSCNTTPIATKLISPNALIATPTETWWWGGRGGDVM